MKDEEEQLTVDLPKTLMRSFRKEASAAGDFKRGYIKKAAKEAIIMWLKSRGVEYTED